MKNKQGLALIEMLLIIILIGVFTIFLTLGISKYTSDGAALKEAALKDNIVVSEKVSELEIEREAAKSAEKTREKERLRRNEIRETKSDSMLFKYLLLSILLIIISTTVYLSINNKKPVDDIDFKVNKKEL